MTKSFPIITAAIVGLGLATAITQAAPAQAEPLLSCPLTQAAVAGGETSCEFAANVRYAWFHQPGNPVIAYSPVTHRLYSMMCVNGFTLQFPNLGINVSNATRCVDADGGNAIAYVW